MRKNEILSLEILINQNRENVWRVLTTKELFNECFDFLNIEFNELKIGEKIFFKILNSNVVDYAIIKQYIELNRLSYEYYKMDSNDFQNISFHLILANENLTKLTITASNLKDEAELQHTKNAWSSMLNTLKSYIERTK
ncbi:MAG TPA: SRPBCC domain-containing protein [Flavobacterium sp.]|nr:SRPBCC domain-containing protein [Flavobacterium sp.]